MSESPGVNVEYQLCYAGLVSDINFASMDPSGRTDLLKILDQAQKSSLILNLRKPLDLISHIFTFKQYHIEVKKRKDQSIELCVPLHLIASVGYVEEEGVHIVCLNIGPDRNNPHRDLAVFCAPSKNKAEEICNTLALRFQSVFGEAVMKSKPRGISPPASSKARVIPRSGLPSAETQGTSIYSSSDTSNDILPRSLSINKTQLVEEYYKLLSKNLNMDEMKTFAQLCQRSQTSELPFREFAHKMMELFGPQRTELLIKLGAVINESDRPEFVEFLSVHQASGKLK